jgi:NADH-quinone oxidoreductase subunit N
VLVCFALIDPSNPEATKTAFSAAIVYLAIYALMDLGAFAAAIAFANNRGGTYFINDYSGLWNRSPVLATMLAGFLISLAGTPPMGGFWAKVFVFDATIDARVYWLAVVMGINAVIAAWYYLAVVKRMFFEPAETTDEVQVAPLLRVGMAVAAVALFALFVYPPFLTRLTDGSLLFFAGG